MTDRELLEALAWDIQNCLDCADDDADNVERMHTYKKFILEWRKCLMEHGVKPEMDATVNAPQYFNSADVYKYIGRDKSVTLFVRLPKSEQKACPQQHCDCGYCKAHPGEMPMWDTLAISPDREHTWTVHMPDMALAMRAQRK